MTMMMVLRVTLASLTIAITMALIMMMTVRQ